MSKLKNFIIVAFPLAVYSIFNYYLNSSTDIKDLHIEENKWWGPGSPKPNTNNQIVPFQINVSDKELEDLNSRLSRFLEKTHVPPLEDQGFQYGFNSNFLKQVVTYWRNDYQWRTREKYLNRFPQFKVNINGLDIHFIRVTPKKTTGVKVLPLLLLHGWPGSVREFYEVIPLLTNPKKDVPFVFEVVAASLPGFGFSQGSSKPGFGPAQIATIMKNLMVRLGFNKFYVSGGDWGAVIGKNLGQMYPEKILGLHSTMCLVNTPLFYVKWALASVYPPLVVEDKYRHKLYPLTTFIPGLLKEAGYFVLQATKPDTIGTALSDTPAGLAAYILEKFSTATNKKWQSRPDGGLTEKFSLETLLDNIMIYWFSNSIATSQRIYSESLSSINYALSLMPIKVPTSCTHFENEILWQPITFLKEQYLNLLQVTNIENVGHFSALEEPKIFSEDLWSAAVAFEKYYKDSKENKA